jgi:uncharacterized membrane protein (UPF0127 family)
MVLVNATKNTVLSDRCRFANSVIKRMIGLLNRKMLATGEGLLIDRCYGIHTFGMRFSLDVLFLDKDLRVMRAVAGLPPLRTCIVRKAVYVLELPVGAIQRSRTEAGDQIQFRTSENETTTSLRIPAQAGNVPA